MFTPAKWSKAGENQESAGSGDKVASTNTCEALEAGSSPGAGDGLKVPFPRPAPTAPQSPSLRARRTWGSPAFLR